MLFNIVRTLFKVILSRATLKTLLNVATPLENVYEIRHILKV